MAEVEGIRIPYLGDDLEVRKHALETMGENFLPRAVVESVVALNPDEFGRLMYLVTLIRPSELDES